MAGKGKAVPAERVLMQALEPVRHDGKDIAPGQLFGALPEAVEVLLAGGTAIVPDLAPEDLSPQ